LNKHTLVPAESSYPFDPLFLSNDTQDTNNIKSAIQKASRESSVKDEDDNRLTWTEEIHELLVVTLHKVFSDKEAADNSFKKAIFQACVLAVCKAYKGSRSQDINWLKYKNK
jgi:hypothetical protein